MFRSFWPSLLIRFLLIGASATLLAYFWLLGTYPINFFIWAAVTIILSVHTAFFIQKTLDSIDQYITGLKNGDFSNIPLNYYKWGRLSELRKKLEETSDSYKALKLGTKKDSEIFKIATSLAPVGILMWKSNGKIILFNNALKGQLQLEGVLSMDRLEKLRPILAKKLLKIEAGYAGIIEYENGDIKNKFSARKSFIKAEEELYTMIVLQSVNKELENAETQAWEKLMKIMTHEIMNSITSVHSLSSTLTSLIEKDEKENSLRAIKSIERRSSGLLQFVKDYRTLSEIPSPDMEEIELSEFLHSFKKEVEHVNPKIDIEIEINRNPKALSDPDQLRLVLTNLYLNSSHALKNSPAPKIEIKVRHSDEGLVVIHFVDNGAGMNKSTLENSFVPFYTTRKEGSGIGLPLSRQLLRAMGGRLNLESKEGKGCTAKISLKNPVLTSQ